MKLYVLDGIGTEVSATHSLQLEGVDLKKLEWPLNLRRGDGVKKVADEISKQIGLDAGAEFGILGISVSGIVVLAMAEICKPSFVIIMSCPMHKEEVPWYYGLLRMARLSRLVTPFWVRKAKYLIKLVMRRASKKEYIQYERMLESEEPERLLWGLRTIVETNYDQLVVPRGVDMLRTHGTKDPLFQVREGAEVEHVVGGHFLLPAKANQVSVLIGNFLESRKNKKG